MCSTQKPYTFFAHNSQTFFDFLVYSSAKSVVRSIDNRLVVVCVYYSSRSRLPNDSVVSFRINSSLVEVLPQIPHCCDTDAHNRIGFRIYLYLFGTMWIVFHYRDVLPFAVLSIFRPFCALVQWWRPPVHGRWEANKPILMVSSLKIESISSRSHDFTRGNHRCVQIFNQTDQRGPIAIRTRLPVQTPYENCFQSPAIWQ